MSVFKSRRGAKSRAVLLAGAAGLSSLALVGANLSAASASPKAKPAAAVTGPVVSIGLGEPLSPPEVPQQAPFIAQDLGLFKKYHLKVKIDYMPNGLQSELGTTANSITLGMAGGSDSLEAAAQGAPIHAVWVTYQKLDLVCIGGPGIKTVKDLIGKNVGSSGAGGFAQTTMDACLTAGGVKLNQVHEINMTRAEFVPALASNRIQAAVFHADDAYTVLHEIKGATILEKEYQSLPEYWYGSLNVRDGYAKTHPLVVEHTIAALMAADRWMMDPKNNARFITLAVKDTGESRPAVASAIKFDRGLGLWNTSCAVNRTSVKFTSDLLHSQGSITRVPTFSQVYNGAYCQKAMQLVG